MKILNDGESKKPLEWWVGLQITCTNCKAKFELEKGDRVTAASTDNKPFVLVHCPKCSNLIRKVK